MYTPSCVADRAREQDRVVLGGRRGAQALGTRAMMSRSCSRAVRTTLFAFAYAPALIDLLDGRGHRRPLHESLSNKCTEGGSILRRCSFARHPVRPIDTPNLYNMGEDLINGGATMLAMTCTSRSNPTAVSAARAQQCRQIAGQPLNHRRPAPASAWRRAVADGYHGLSSAEQPAPATVEPATAAHTLVSPPGMGAAVSTLITRSSCATSAAVSAKSRTSGHQVDQRQAGRRFARLLGRRAFLQAVPRHAGSPRAAPAGQRDAAAGGRRDRLGSSADAAGPHEPIRKPPSSQPALPGRRLDRCGGRYGIAAGMLSSVSRTPAAATSGAVQVEGRQAGSSRNPDPGHDPEPVGARLSAWTPTSAGGTSRMISRAPAPGPGA